MKPIYAQWAAEELAKARKAQDHDVPARREELARENAADHLADRIAADCGIPLTSISGYDVLDAQRLIATAADEQRQRDAVACTLREYVLAAAAHERAKSELLRALFPAGFTADDGGKLDALNMALERIMCQTSDPRDVGADEVAHLMAIVA